MTVGVLLASTATPPDELIIFQNQDFDKEPAEEKMLVACLARMLSPPLNLHILTKKRNHSEV